MLSNGTASQKAHVSALINGKMITYGGTLNFGQLYVYTIRYDTNGIMLDSNEWHSPTTTSSSSSSMSSRNAPAVEVFADRYMLFLGGQDSSGLIYYSDLWSLDTFTWTWSLIKIDNTAPTGRYYAKMILIGKKLFVHGGQNRVAAITTCNSYFIGPITGLSVNSDSGSDYLCFIKPHLYSCKSIKNSIAGFSYYSGLMQNFTLTSSVFAESSISLKYPVSIFSNSTTTWVCGNAGCMTIALSSNVFTQLSNITFTSSTTSIITMSSEKLKINDCIFRDSVSNLGAALSISGGSTVNIISTNFFNLSSNSMGGAIFSVSSTVSLSSSQFFNNFVLSSSIISPIYGGALALMSSTVTITDSIFSSNYLAAPFGVSTYGGAVYSFSSNLSLKTNIFISNVAVTGGAAYLYFFYLFIVIISRAGATSYENPGFSYLGMSIASFNSNQFVSNNATTGGAIFAYFTNFNSSNDIFDSNKATQDGGSISFTPCPFIKLSGAIFSNNNAGGNGGSIYLTGTAMTVTGSYFTHNSAYVNGGSIYTMAAQSYLNDTLFASNSAADGGSIFSSSSALDMNSCNFTSNTANVGAGIYWSRTLSTEHDFVPVIRSCNFISNYALKYGNNTASMAIGLSFFDTPNEFVEQNASMYINPSFTVGLVDYYNQIVTNDSITALTVLPFVLVSGETVKTVSNGICKFSAVSIAISPNSFFHMRVNCPTVYDVGFFNTANKLILTRKCIVGEFNGGIRGCVSCYAGTYSDVIMASVCTSCQAGKFSSTGASVCNNCSAGMYAPSSGLSSCLTCAEKAVQAFVGQNVCVNCPQNSFPANGSIICQCQSGYYASIPSSNLFSANGNFSCTPCGAGANCISDSLTYDTVVPAAGAFPVLNTPSGKAIFQDCLLSTACVGGHADQNCASNYRGVLCASCDLHYRSNKTTIKKS